MATTDERPPPAEQRELAAPQVRLGPGDRLFYLHIPKCGGTSLAAILESHFHVDEVCPAQNHGSFRALEDDELARYRLLRGHVGYDIHARLPAMPTFVTMLREPVERVVSLYHFWRESPLRDGGRGRGGERIAKELDFARFLESEEQRVVRWVDDAQAYQIVSDVTERRGRRNPDDLLAAAKARLDSFPFVGLAERYDESLALLAHAFGWAPMGEAPRLNPTRARPATADLEPAIRRRIEARVGVDLRLYDYAWDLVERRLTAMRQEVRGVRAADWRGPPIELGGRGLDIDFAQAIDGLNWHVREGVRARGFRRWTGPGTPTTLDVRPSTDADWLLRLRVVDAVAADIAEGVRVRVDGTPLERAASPRLGRRGLSRWRLPRHRAPAGEALRLEIETPRTAPSPRPDDPRQVGVLLDGVALIPGGPAARLAFVARSEVRRLRRLARYAARRLLRRG